MLIDMQRGKQCIFQISIYLIDNMKLEKEFCSNYVVFAATAFCNAVQYIAQSLAALFSKSFSFGVKSQDVDLCTALVMT